MIAPLSAEHSQARSPGVHDVDFVIALMTHDDAHDGTVSVSACLRRRSTASGDGAAVIAAGPTAKAGVAKSNMGGISKWRWRAAKTGMREKSGGNSRRICAMMDRQRTLSESQEGQRRTKGIKFALPAGIEPKHSFISQSHSCAPGAAVASNIPWFHLSGLGIAAVAHRGFVLHERSAGKAWSSDRYSFLIP